MNALSVELVYKLKPELDMKVNSAMLISLPVLLLGYFLNQPHTWIPFTVLLASAVDLLTRKWVSSDKIGTARNLSILVKGLFGLIGFYAMLGQIICLGLVFWWYIK